MEKLSACTVAKVPSEAKAHKSEVEASYFEGQLFHFSNKFFYIQDSMKVIDVTSCSTINFKSCQSTI